MTTTAEPTQLLTFSEAGQRMSMSPKAVANLTRRGELPRVVIGARRIRVAEADVEAFIRSKKETVR